MISDRGPQFVAELTKELNKMLRIEIRLSMAFHPQWTDKINKPRIGAVFEVLHRV